MELEDTDEYSSDIAVRDDETDGLFKTVDALFNDFVPVGKDFVISEVMQSKSLGWSWSVYNSGVYHTAVVLHLDGQPKYSVNWGPASGTYTSQLYAEVDGEITFGSEMTEDGTLRNPSIKYLPVLGSTKIPDISEEEVGKILDKLFTFNEKKYHLITCNCRDHVLQVMQAMNVREMEQIISEVNNERLRAERFLKNLFKR